METGELIRLAKDCGFSRAAEMDPRRLVFRPEVRQMCRENKCGHYDKSWACPPALRGLEELTSIAADYSLGLLVQTIGTLEDSLDYEAMLETGRRHGRYFDTLTGKLLKLYPSALPMGAGTCTRCESCAYPDAPCRFPEYLHPSMEACGLLVSEVCSLCGLPYYYGPGTIAFLGCYLLS